MASDFRLPKLAEKETTGTVARVTVAAGDVIESGQVVAEVETEKAVVEVPAESGGTVVKVYVKAGDEVKEGTLLLRVETGKGASEPASAPAQATEADETKAADPSPRARTQPKAAPDETLAAKTDDLDEDEALAEPPAASDNVRPLVPAAPSVRRLARELGIAISQVAGSGPHGRVSEVDVKAYAKKLIAGGSGRASEALPDFSRWGEVQREKLSAVRKATAHHLSRSWPEVPQVTQFDRADVTLLEAARRHHVQDQGAVKVTPTAVLLYVAARLIRESPKFRSSLDLTHEELIVKESVHIGVAVDTERGLLVPVVRDADRKSLVQLARDLTELSLRAREAKLGLAEMEGGVFTISNLGGIGGSGFTPVVNWPETAILGVARTATDPVWQDGAFVPRDLMPLSLSYDHRVIDGAEAARFLRRLCERLEDPFHLMLEG
ncbi:MAG: 2-oxo acid dehydrogenase subunit E2 [Sulfobacillus sp.]